MELNPVNTKRVKKNIAQALWSMDGKPNDSELTKKDYRDWVNGVINELYRQGYVIHSSVSVYQVSSTAPKKGNHAKAAIHTDNFGPQFCRELR